MKTTKLKSSLALAFILTICCSSLKAQDDIAILSMYTPEKIRFQVSSAGNSLSSAKFLTKSHSKLSIKAYASEKYSDATLTVPTFIVDLVRRGKLIASSNISEEGDITDLLQKALDGDIVNFRIPEVLIKNDTGSFETFTKAAIAFYYEFKDREKLVLN